MIETEISELRDELEHGARGKLNNMKIKSSKNRTFSLSNEAKLSSTLHIFYNNRF